MPEKILPRKVRNLTRGYILGAAFTWSERLRILFGARVVVSVTMFSEHKPGQTATKGRFLVTDQEELRAAARELEAIEEAEQQRMMDLLAKKDDNPDKSETL